jgi:hypothetical protein
MKLVVLSISRLLYIPSHLLGYATLQMVHSNRSYITATASDIITQNVPLCF